MVAEDGTTRRIPVRSQAWSLTAVAVSALLTIVSVVTLAFFDAEHGKAQSRASTDVAVVQAARHHAIEMLSVDKADLEGYSARVLAEATGQWREDFLANRDSLLGILQGATEKAIGVVNDAGIAGRAEDGTVSVLVSAKVVQGSGQDERGTPVRMRLGIASADGQLKLAKVEIVR